MVKNLPAMQETWVRILGWEDPLVKGKATHSSVRSGESHRLYSPWGRKEWDTTEQLSLSLYPLAQRFFPQPRLVYLTSHQRQSSFLFQCFYVQHFFCFFGSPPGSCVRGGWGGASAGFPFSHRKGRACWSWCFASLSSQARVNWFLLQAALLTAEHSGKFQNGSFPLPGQRQRSFVFEAVSQVAS